VRPAPVPAPFHAARGPPARRVPPASPPRRSSDLAIDQTRLEQILVNLLSNALDALRGQPRRELWLSGARHGASYRLEVRDSGSGDRKTTRLNSSHVKISYAVFCLKKKNAARWAHD